MSPYLCLLCHAVVHVFQRLQRSRCCITAGAQFTLPLLLLCQSRGGVFDGSGYTLLHAPDKRLLRALQGPIRCLRGWCRFVCVCLAASRIVAIVVAVAIAIAVTARLT